MTTAQEIPSGPPLPRKLSPGYEDTAWDYGNPFGQVKMTPLRLAWSRPPEGGNTTEEHIQDE